MQVGDPKKAAVLGVVALVIVSAGVFQLIPKKPQAMAQALTPANTPAPQTVTPIPTSSPEPPKVLVSDPFSHPHLAKKIEAARNATEQAVTDSEKPPQRPSFGSTLPFNPEIQPGIGIQPDPDKSAGNDQEHIVESAAKDKKAVKLTGIVTVGHSIALVTIGENTYRLGVGAHVSENAVITAVGQDGVVVELTLKKEVPIRVRRPKQKLASAPDTTKPTEPEKAKDDSKAKDQGHVVKFKTVTIKKQFALRVGETINL